jgi:hypothetical protein
MKKFFIFASIAFAALLLASMAIAAPLVSFEDLATGTNIAGDGNAYPSLVITPVPSGDATVIETGVSTWATYGAPNNTTEPSQSNNGLEDANGLRVDVNKTPGKHAKGFGNIAANKAGGKQDFDFSFLGGVTVAQFSIRVFDWSDFKPNPGNMMGLQLTAKDSGGNILDQKTVSLTAVQEAGNPRIATFEGATIDPYFKGDAIDATLGQPGYIELSVASPTGIAKVEFRMLGAWDPNIGFDSINFITCTRTIGFWKNHTWGGMTVTINSENITEAIGRGPADLKPGTGILWQATGKNFSMLYAQLLAAELNMLAGGGSGNENLIMDAEKLLKDNEVFMANFYADFPSKSVKSQAANLASQLDTFNNSFPCECQQSQ